MRGVHPSTAALCGLTSLPSPRRTLPARVQLAPALSTPPRCSPTFPLRPVAPPLSLPPPQASPQVGVMVRELRCEMDRLLGAKIASPDMELGGSKLVEAVEGLLSTDGF